MGKILSDGTEVSARTWYYLLTWNDFNNWQVMQKEFDKIKLHDLTFPEYKKLWKIATDLETEWMNQY